MKKIILTYGIIAGFIVSLWLLTAAFIGQNEILTKYGMFFGFTSMIIAFAFIFVAVKRYRDNQLEGSITFGQALKIGVLISLVASTFYVLTWMVEFHYFIPDFMEKMTSAQIQNWKAEGLPEAELQKNIESMENWKKLYKSPVMVALITYMEILPLGLVVSLFAALILKKKPHSKG
ncbi:DUF4199 domain-containing protein [Flavobacterium selenitireducens]|uniref:DUF4199 domain-containing protein n=1 Tax=Flavobacterium selenitireducens TaxID=2722704 RepID=UPI00168AA9F5|nr:DUF4199 domain-containing protein [Flavobacterium selenitireducens]MBD3581051.1 DUF4199 domain-containing protein [Flavobacterium selenitireducens]